MPVFLKLTTKSGDVPYVNMSAVELMFDNGNGTRLIFGGDDVSLDVKETRQQILEAIREERAQ